VSETAITILACVALFIGVPLALLMLRDRISKAISRRRNPPEKLAAERRAYEARIANPDWPFYERHLQRGVPPAILALYSDHELLLTEGVEYDAAHFISTFEPLDERAHVDTRKVYGVDVVPFASSDGDIIYLRPGATETDAVFITYHDGGDTEQLGTDVGVFLQRLRETKHRA